MSNCFVNLVFQKVKLRLLCSNPSIQKIQHQNKYLFKISRKDHSCIQQVRRSQKSRFQSVLVQMLRPVIKNTHFWVDMRNQWVRGTKKLFWRMAWAVTTGRYSEFAVNVLFLWSAFLLALIFAILTQTRKNKRLVLRSRNGWSLQGLFVVPIAVKLAFFGCLNHNKGTNWPRFFPL